MNSANESTRRAAEVVHQYLAETDPLPSSPCDGVLGFGMFDLKLPRFCGDLYARGLVRRIVFIGGIGAGTGDLGQPEANAWREELQRSHPAIPASDVIIENQSTNTAENIGFTAALLEREHPELTFGRGLRQVLVVASPSRLRRVRLTLRLLQPDVKTMRCLPPTDYDTEAALYTRQGIDYIAHLCGELDRLVSYPQRGWITPEPLPEPVTAAHALLRTAQHN